MPSHQLHANELPTGIDVARRLVRTQFPQWADLPLEPVQSAGTVHAIYRLGAGLQVRLPRLVEWVPDAATEFIWMRRLASQLPLLIPTPIEFGLPTEEYPAAWTIYDWIEGDVALPATIEDHVQTAHDLARFIRSLQAIDTTDAPRNTHRGGPLQAADAETRAAIERLSDDIDREAVLVAWERALAAPAWDRPAVWTHGDLWHSNLLTRHGRIVAVIDFGSAGIGDPAIDTIIGWSLLTSHGRETFRTAAGIDDATWIRGAGWAISMAALALPYYQDTNPVIVANSRRMISEVLSGID